jgi:ABC-type nitrate/sulfonate/bicarbonate transport system substrate-binding protein
MRLKPWMVWPLILLLAGVIFNAGCSSKPTSSESAPVIGVSHQPCVHALPTYMAMQKGWDKAEGLKIDYQFYVSGPPQNEALASNKWEVGAEGAVPGMLAAIRYGAYIIAISNDESETNDLWVRPDSPILKVKGANPKYPDLYGSAAAVKGKTILLTTASTGHYAVIATLKALGLSEQDVKLVHMEQSQAMAAFEAGQGDIVQLWAPFDYIGESKGWKKMSSGKRAGAVIPGVVLASKKAFEENPAKVAKWLKLYMKGIAEMKANPTDSAKLLGAYYKEHGLTLDDHALAQEFSLRPIFDTKEQLALFARKDGAPSQVEQWMSDLADFFVQQGRISPAEKDKFMKGNFMNDKILKMIGS